MGAMQRRSQAAPNLVEKYIRGQVVPRFMQRLREIEDELARHRSRLADAYEERWESCGGGVGADAVCGAAGKAEKPQRELGPTLLRRLSLAT